ncbi:uncharacterized protein LOC106356747 isoform X1 [Brassica napus]|uniref:uncharacterized protein LOC106356747 isoform X1 n=1 Tax=Brassica napus TaxID=3708 RepID=UPI0006AAE3B3|nr:uncharacterized protein LOC106356747 isoform X1 [Brassica napus]
MSFMVSPSWHTNWLEEISNIELNHRSATKPSTKSPFSLHLSSSNKHCQDLSNAAGGEMISNSMGPCSDSCSVCLETKWNLAADGCGHEFCTKCALYLSTTNIPQVVPKNNSNKQSMETPSEAFVASTLYEVEEDRVGVPLLSGLYEFRLDFFSTQVIRGRKFQPSRLLAGSWEAWLKVDPSLLPTPTTFTMFDYCCKQKQCICLLYICSRNCYS